MEVCDSLEQAQSVYKLKGTYQAERRTEGVGRSGRALEERYVCIDLWEDLMSTRAVSSR